jgi:subtilisin family serine protease
LLFLPKSGRRGPAAPHRLALSLVAGLASSCFLAAGSGADTTYYYCPPGLVALGTSDAEAQGSNCAFWLLPSFPLGESAVPAANARRVAGLDVVSTWRRTRGAGVVVGLLDSGVDPGQADLAPNLLPGENTLANTPDTTDTDGHGTVLASVIAAAEGNGGYVGIAPEARLLPVKMMSGPDTVGSPSAAVAAVYWAIAHGARVLNCSFGDLNTPIPGMDAALAAAAKADVLVVIAAGNDGASLDDGRHTEYPDGYGLPNTLTVAALSADGTLAPESNFGPLHVQIASLGDTLYGDFPGTTTGGFVGGTSAATATVSGVAALLFAAYPDATAAQVRRAIIVGANTDSAALRGQVESGGELSASGALAAMASPDTTAPAAFRALGPPSSFRAAGRGFVRFRWQPSADAELEGYRLVVDGKTTAVPPGRTSRVLELGAGPHAWSVSAFDLSGNTTTAGR